MLVNMWTCLCTIHSWFTFTIHTFGRRLKMFHILLLFVWFRIWFWLLFWKRPRTNRPTMILCRSFFLFPLLSIFWRLFEFDVHVRERERNALVSIKYIDGSRWRDGNGFWVNRNRSITFNHLIHLARSTHKHQAGRSLFHRTHNAH